MEATKKRESWNKGKLVGQKPPLKPKDIWAITARLQNEDRLRELALADLRPSVTTKGGQQVQFHRWSAAFQSRNTSISIPSG